MTERSSILMEATSSMLQESLDSEASVDHISLWRDVDPFPVVLHRMLGDMEKEGSEHIISWNDDGMSFTIHQPKEFAATILTRYFRNQTRYKSFQRQLNLYRFHRISTAKERAAYAHKSFARDSPHLCQFVRRTRKQPMVQVPDVVQARPNPVMENFPFIPTTLPFELTLTHSANSDVTNNHDLHGKQLAMTSCPISCVIPCADLEISTGQHAGPLRSPPCHSPNWACKLSTDKRERSESHLSLREWLATLRPACASRTIDRARDDLSITIDRAWDDLTLGSIDCDDLTISSSLILANHDDNMSWACCSVDGEIFQ